MGGAEGAAGGVDGVGGPRYRRRGPSRHCAMEPSWGWLSRGSVRSRAARGRKCRTSAGVPYDPVPLTAQRYDSVVGDWVGAGGDEAQIREALYRPSHLPAVSNLIAGDDGTIWLQRYDPVVVETGELMSEWWVLDSEGSPLGRALTPEGLEVKLVTDGTLWGIERDELDVEYIVRYRLVQGR